MPVFFWDWPIWARLSFVLGGLFVVVFSVAGLVKLHRFVQMKKLLKAQIRDLERTETRERVRSSDEIPFGAKAMMEDPDVEGVWNSRASTPLQSPILAPRSSSPSRHSLHSLNPFSKSRRNSSLSSLDNFHLPAASPSHLAGTLLLPIPPAIEPAGASSSTVPALSRNSQEVPWQYQIPTPYPQNTSSMPRRRSVTIRAAPPSPADAAHESQHMLPALEHRRRDRVSTDPFPTTPKQHRRSRKLVVRADSTTPERTPTTRKALDRMEAHRKFHAAESGQLQPRPRTIEDSGSQHKYSTSDSFISDPESSNRAVSWPITPGEVLIDLNASQRVETKTSSHAVPFRAFVEMHPPPKTTPRAPPSAWTDKTQGLLDEKLEAQTPKKKIVIKNNSAGKKTSGLYVISQKETPKDEHEKVSLLGTQKRRVNDGFEVLPAGSLKEPNAVKDFGHATLPLRESSNDRQRPRKLQKRSRSSSRDGHASADTIRHVTV